MKRGISILLFFTITTIGSAQIVADHTIVDRYADIPQYYIDEVKKMLVDIGGESHSVGYQNGVILLEMLDPRFRVMTYINTGPPAVTDQYLRLGRPYMYGEDIWTSQAGIDNLTETLADQYYTGNPYDIFAFGWCWDMCWVNLPGGTIDPVYGVHWAGTTDGGPEGSRRWGLDAEDQVLTGNSVCMDTYLSAIEQYNTYFKQNGISTRAIFTTGPVDSYTDENAFQRELKHDHIRNYVNAGSDRVLFDYADILCYNNKGEKYTEEWDDGGNMRPYAQIHPDNMYEYDASWNITPPDDEDGDHIGEVGALRIAKAMWWLLARLSGWEGRDETTWEGNAGSSWDDPLNWSDGVPDSTTDVIIPDVTPYPVIEPGVSAVCYNLRIETGAVLTINSVTGNSGSLIVNGLAYGSVTYNCRMPDDALYHYVSSPLGSPDLPAAGTFWAWDEVSGDWGDPVTECVSGAGYTIKANGGIISFTGSIVNAPEPVVATSPYLDCDFIGGAEDDYSLRPFATGRDDYNHYGGGGWNLLGNPFTSAMDARAFISYNETSFDQNYKALYIYDGATYSYIGSELTGWENASGTFGSDDVQAGQGFFVAARCNSCLFSFTSGMQVHDPTVTLTKSASAAGPWPGLQLEVRSAAGAAYTIVVFNEGMTTDLDPGYDVGQMNAGTGIGLYTSLAATENGVRYARQALPATGADAITVPVGIDFGAGGEVVFSASTVPLPGNKYWLEDRVTGVYTDLCSGSYKVSLPANTSGTGRFFILTSSGSPSGTEQIPAEEAGIRIWSSGDKVIISGQVTEAARCEIYNLQGQMILETRLDDGMLNPVIMPHGSRGVFLVRVTDGTKALSRKVLLP
jgi:hypothetical protein